MRKYLAALVVLGIVGLCSPDTASADLLLRISDGTTTYTVIDNGSVGDVSSGGNTADLADTIATVGAVSYSGSIGGFVLSVAVGTSKPLVDDRLDLFSLDVTGGSGGTLTIEVTDTDFMAVSSQLWLAAGGTTDGTVSLTSYGDSTNAEFGTGTTGPTLGPFSGGAFSGSLVTTGPSASGPFSMTLKATVTHTAGGQASSFNAILTPVPEPGSLVLVGTGMMFFGGTSLRRRRRKTAA